MKRLSVAGMMGVILLAAVGAAALSAPSELWCCAFYSVALAAIGLSTVVGVLGRGRFRAFWLGFALFGGGYIYLAYDSSGDLPVWGLGRQRPAPGAPRPRLVTALLLDLVYEYVPKPALPAVGEVVEVQWGGPEAYFPATVTKHADGRVEILWSGYQAGQEEWVTTSRVRNGAPGYFHATGHAIFAILLGLLGGIGCQAVFGWQSDERQSSPHEPPPRASR